MARTRLARRETLREAVLRWTIPFCAVRTMTGSASLKAARAAFLSPEAMASSTLRVELRMRLRRALFASVRRTVWRAAFFADLVLAMAKSFGPVFASVARRDKREFEGGVAALYRAPSDASTAWPQARRA